MPPLQDKNALKAARIEAAKEFRDALASGAAMPREDHRHAYIYDQMAAAVAGICEKHVGGTGKPVFHAQQVECLTEIASQIALALDPKSARRVGVRAHIWRGFKEADLAKQVAIIAGVLTIIGVLSAGAVTIGRVAIGWISGPDSIATDPPTLDWMKLK
jgi:hypothetical protein